MVVKNGQLGFNESTFMPIFYAYTSGFSVALLSKIRTGNSVCKKCTISYLQEYITYIFQENGITYFFW